MEIVKTEYANNTWDCLIEGEYGPVHIGSVRLMPSGEWKAIDDSSDSVYRHCFSEVTRNRNWYEADTFPGPVTAIRFVYQNWVYPRHTMARLRAHKRGNRSLARSVRLGRIAIRKAAMERRIVEMFGEMCDSVGVKLPEEVSRG